MPYVRRYSRFKRKSYSYPRSRSYAARKIQSGFRKRRQVFARRVTTVIRNQEPVKYCINDPSSGGSQWVLQPYGNGPPVTYAGTALANIAIIPFAPTPSSAGSRQSRKVFLQNLNITWNLSNGLVYAAGQQPTIVRIALLEARACDLRLPDVLLNPSDLPSPITGNSLTQPYNHKMVKVLWTKNVTLGSLQGYADQGYKSGMQFKTNHKLNRLSMYENVNAALTTDMPLKRNLYLYACAPDNLVINNIRVSCATTLSFKSME